MREFKGGRKEGEVVLVPIRLKGKGGHDDGSGVDGEEKEEGIEMARRRRRMALDGIDPDCLDLAAADCMGSGWEWGA